MYIDIIFPFLEKTLLPLFRAIKPLPRSVSWPWSAQVHLETASVWKYMGSSSGSVKTVQTPQGGKTPFPHHQVVFILLNMKPFLYFCYLFCCVIFTWLTFRVTYVGMPLFLVPLTVCSPVLQLLLGRSSPDRVVPLAAAGVVSGGSNIWGYDQIFEVSGSLSEDLWQQQMVDSYENIIPQGKDPESLFTNPIYSWQGKTII